MEINKAKLSANDIVNIALKGTLTSLDDISKNSDRDAEMMKHINSIGK